MGKIVRQILFNFKNNKSTYLHYFLFLYETIYAQINKINGIESTLSAQASELANSFFISLFQEYQESYFEIEINNLQMIMADNSNRVIELMQRSKDFVKYNSLISMCQNIIIYKYRLKKELKEKFKDGLNILYLIILKQIKLDQLFNCKNDVLLKAKTEMQHRLTIMKDILLQEYIETIFSNVHDSLNRNEKVSLKEQRYIYFYLQYVYQELVFTQL